ncbi:acidic tetraheme cytochrome c3 TmcA [Desulfonema magnum]|uniref:Tmc redox complex, acidic cyctchrome c n=1 Tax=Desulfonema magnum TaxID=45655 RepID=A0A975BU59_9BACT|nr:cytochrome c3 family protein [Desulfonema magnum]QTA91688.1 putative tmc redox complex, acidic cyctchrome c [Desulfonema magnum]
MKKKNLMVYMVFMVFVSVVAVISGFSQEDITTVQDSAFDIREIMRPSVPFLHDEHNEKAQIEECNVCHHTYNEGKKVEDESSEGMECSACHLTEKNDDPIELVRVYHLQCKGCHEQKNAGPVMCGECHVK